MKLPEVLRRVRCPACEWQAVWGPEEMLQILRLRGAFRREKVPDIALVVHLFEQIASQVQCSACQHRGMELSACSADFEVEAIGRPCEVCGRFIPVERLQVFPNARRCAACQESATRGANEDDFCPRCGGLVELRLTRDPAAARYRITCPNCGWKQLS